MAHRQGNFKGSFWAGIRADGKSGLFSITRCGYNGFHETVVREWTLTFGQHCY
jgi:hypothetical protein